MDILPRWGILCNLGGQALSWTDYSSRCGLALFMALSLTFPAKAAEQSAGPSWAEMTPESIRYSKFAGLAGVCWAIPTFQGLLLPIHCLPEAEDAGDNASVQRDYVFLPMNSSAGRRIGRGELAENDKKAGQSLWLKRGETWSLVKIVSSSSSVYFVKIPEGQPLFCPGDSGASAWGFETGGPKWEGMVVSGESLGCSQRATLVKARAMRWDY